MDFIIFIRVQNNFQKAIGGNIRWSKIRKFRKFWNISLQILLIPCIDHLLYFSMSVCVFPFFSVTAEPFVLKFSVVFRISVGKVLSNSLGSMVA